MEPHSKQTLGTKRTADARYVYPPSMVDMAGTYSNGTDVLQNFADLRKRIDRIGPRKSRPTRPRSSGGSKKHLGADEVAAIVAKYTAGAPMTQLMAEHHIAKRIVAKIRGWRSDRGRPKALTPLPSIGSDLLHVVDDIYRRRHG